MSMVLPLLMAVVTAQTSTYNNTYVSVYLKGSSFEIVPRPNGAKPFLLGEYAYGNFTDKIMVDGWSHLDIHTNPVFPDNDTAKAAGYLEGFLTAERMEQYAHNMQIEDYTISKHCKDKYFDPNEKFLKEMIKKSLKLEPSDPLRIYWWQVNIVLQQLEGLHEGYQSARKGAGTLTKENLLFLNMQNELADIIDAYGGNYLYINCIICLSRAR